MQMLRTPSTGAASKRHAMVSRHQLHNYGMKKQDMQQSRSLLYPLGTKRTSRRALPVHKACGTVDIGPLCGG
jgi:hypothetical protein